MSLETSASNGGSYFMEYSGNNSYSNGSYYKDGSNDGKDMSFIIEGND